MPKPKAEILTDEITRFQKSEAVIVDRSQIKNAPYNPRKISPEALKGLKANIKKIGLLGGIVVNKTTWHLVSGHQRLSVLDSLEKSENYKLRVELVELDEKTEKEQNIFMNSSSVQGEFDLDQLSLILPEIDYSAAGLNESDLHILGVLDTLPEAIPELADDVTDTYHDRKDKVKAMKKNIKEGYSDKFNTEPIVTLSFSSNRSKEDFMRRFGYDPLASFVNGDLFSERIERLD